MKTPFYSNLNMLWLIPNRMAPWYHELAAALTDLENIEITFLTFSHEQEEGLKRTKTNGIKTIIVRTPRGWIDLASLKVLRVLKLRKALANVVQEFDLIHIHGTEHQYQEALGQVNLPTITSIQGILTEYVKFSNKPSKIWLSWLLGTWYEKRAVRTKNNYFCRTEWDKAFIRKYNEKAHIFHCWELIRKPFFEVTCEPIKSNALFYLGGTNSIKGFRELLIAFNEICSEIPEAKLYMAGNSNLKKAEKFIRDQKLNNLSNDNLIWMGHLSTSEHVAQMLRSRFLVHPSYIDNSPNTVCEAQIAGLPVLATDVGGVSSLIRHGDTGFLIEKGISALTQGLRSFYNDVPLLSHISITAMNAARKRHDPDQIVQDTLTAYAAIKEKKNQTRN